MPRGKPIRIAYVTSHPIQYQSPLFREIAAQPGVDFEAIYLTDYGQRPTFDPGFGRCFQWDIPLLGGFRHRFLKNWSLRPGPTFRGQVNPELLALLREGAFEAVVVHGYASASTVAAILAPRAAGTRLLLRGDSQLGTARSPAKRMSKRILLPLLFRRIDHFLAIGQLNEEYYQYYGVPRERISRAGYAVDNDRFAGPSGDAPLDARRNAAGFPCTGPAFLFCGKLISLKRPLDALRAFASVRRTWECAMVFAGDGALRPTLEGAAAELGVADSTYFLGFRNQSELPAIYSACDALLLPSERDAWGLVVNEAMASGLAIAVSDRVGAGPDLVRDNGFVFPVGDVAALAKGLDEWLRYPDRLRAMKMRSRSMIADWALPSVARRFVEAAKSAVERPGVLGNSRNRSTLSRGHQGNGASRPRR